MHAMAAHLLAAACLLGGAYAGVCDQCTTLLEVVDELKAQLPRADDGYTAPSAQVLGHWYSVVTEMLNGNCSADLPPSLAGVYEREVFADDNTKDYCIFASTDPAAPWGTVIVYSGGDAKNLSFHAPHPLADSDTGEQSIAVFRGTNAALFELSGAHRHANATTSPCQAEYSLSDAAHNVDAFQATARAIKQHYSGVNHTAVQFHGMKNSSCIGVNAYITHGSSIPPQTGEKIDLLRDAIAAELSDYDATITVPGDEDACALDGTTNVQGRLLNDVAGDVCTVSSSGYTGRFIHIEQEKWVRHLHAEWIAAFNSVDFGSAVAPRYISLVSPLTGSFGFYTTMNIEWVSSGITGGVKLSLHGPGISTIALDTPNTGSYQFYFDKSWLSTTEPYLLRVRSVDFTSIKSFSQPLTFYKLVTVVSPNGGEQFNSSSPLDIHWSAPEVTGNVEITLRLNGNWKKNIVKDTENDGYYQWGSIPNDVEPGVYTIRIKSIDNSDWKDFSDETFEILP